MGSMKRTRLNIFGYTDFKCFLADRMAELKRENDKFTRSYFSGKLGLSSRSYLSMVIDGSRKLSAAMTRKMCAVLALTREETVFFLDLVQFNQAPDTEAKTEALDKLRHSRRFLKVHQLEMDQFDCLGDPLTLTLREMASLQDFKDDEDWISRRLPGRIGKKKIRQALERLKRVGWLEEDRDGRLRPLHKHQASGVQLGLAPLRAYHLRMLQKAAEAMELPTDLRYFRGLTMSIPTELYGRIVEETYDYIDRVRALVDAGKNCEHVYQLEMSLFPLTKRDVKNETGKKNKK